ncbi:MAG: hypothetical protein ACRYFX_07075 [Janthinobacterium lividum]
MHISFLPAAALAALTLFVTPASHAQGLGGVLNQAKARATQAAALPSAPSALPANGEDPPTPPAMTAETEAEYTRLLLSDTRPVVRGQMNGSYTNWYRQLHQLQHFPIRFTWDQPALARVADNRLWLFGYIEDFSGDLVANLNGTTREAYLRPRLAKIKEIHFTPSSKKSGLDQPGQEQGWFFSFNPGTGVLTAGFGEYASSVSAWSALTNWIVANVK